MELHSKKGDILLALEDFDGLTEDELSFKQGDRITYLEKDASGWAAGKLNGKVGWFPVSFVEPILNTAPLPVALPPPPVVLTSPKLAASEPKVPASSANAKNPLDYRKPTGSVVVGASKTTAAQTRPPTGSVPPVPMLNVAPPAPPVTTLSSPSSGGSTVQKEPAPIRLPAAFADRTSKFVHADGASGKPGSRTSKPPGIPEPLPSPLRGDSTPQGSIIGASGSSSPSNNGALSAPPTPSASTTPPTPQALPPSSSNSSVAASAAATKTTSEEAKARNAKNRQQRKTKCLITQEDFAGFEQFEATFKTQGPPPPDQPVEENSILGAAKYRNSVRIAKWIEQRKTIGDLEKANIFVPQTKHEETKQKKNVLDRFFKKDVEKRAAAPPPEKKEEPRKMPKPKEDKKEKRKTIFGLPFETIMIGKKGARLTVPRVVDDCLRYLSRPDRLAEPGLFRISGDHIQMEKFKGSYQTSTDSVDFEKHKVEAHTVAGLLKQFFKELPEPLFTFSVSDTILTEVEKVPEQKIDATITARLLKLVPPTHRTTIDHLFLFLHRVTDHSEKNMMNSMNLALVLGPTLIRPSVATTESLLKRNDSRFVESLLSHYEQLFGPPPGEPKNEKEKEKDAKDAKDKGKKEKKEK